MREALKHSSRRVLERAGAMQVAVWEVGVRSTAMTSLDLDVTCPRGADRTRMRRSRARATAHLRGEDHVFLLV
jgi:hypothetical protein